MQLALSLFFCSFLNYVKKYPSKRLEWGLNISGCDLARLLNE